MTAAAAPALADAPTVHPVVPFTGQYRETFNGLAEGAYASIPVFGSLGTASIEGDANSVKIEFSSSLNGDLVTPISGKMMGQLGILDWNFNQPLSKFGGYWENNSGASDATVEFYDYDGNPLGNLIATVPVSGQHWVWNGWTFDTPVSRIRVTGNGLINGFIWYDNVDVTPAPEPACGALLGGLGMGFLFRHSRRANRAIRQREV